MKFHAQALVSDLCKAQATAATLRFGRNGRRVFHADKCKGIQWLKMLVEQDPAMTVADLHARVVRDHGIRGILVSSWFLDLLIDQHRDLDPAFRLALIERLTPRHALHLMTLQITFSPEEIGAIRANVRATCLARPDLYTNQWERL